MVNKLIGIFIMIVLILISGLSVFLTKPPPAFPITSDSQIFSAERAFSHLKLISEKPHSIGTEQNQKVRDLIVAECNRLGLKVEVQKAHTLRNYNQLLRSAYVENIIAILPGSKPSKDLLIMSHYDSQPNTPGAGDDGAAVAAMLETMSILSEGARAKNNIIFLFTDGEELGLNGARAFVEQHPLAKEIGLLLNFEGRGNSGPSLTFEVNNNNGWIMREYAKATPYPMANSLSYEIYKTLPNDTDFTVFRNQGITGLNFAFIDGFVNYHSATDTYENLSLNSLQHHGSYMLSLARHFGDLDLSQDTKGPDLTFFNPVGYWLFSYPSSRDLPLALLVSSLLAIWLYFGLRFKTIRGTQLLLGILFFALTVLLIGAFTWFGALAIKATYPHYSKFYGGNFYNAKYYLMTSLSFGVFIFLIIYRWLLKKYKAASLLGSILLIEVVTMAFMYQKIPTAIFLFTYPLIFIVIGQLVILFLGYGRNRQRMPYIVVLGLSYLPAVLLWPPIIYNLFLAFSLDLLAAPVGLLVFLLGMGLPFFEFVAKSRIAVNSFLFLGFIFILLGHFSSSYNAKQPLQSDLVYGLDLTQKEAYWMANSGRLDEWNEKFLGDTSLNQTTFYPEYERWRWSNSAPLIDSESMKPWMQVEKDTLINGQRQLRLIVGAEEPATAFELILADSRKISYLKVNQKVIDPNHYQNGGNYYRLEHYGKPSEGLEVTLQFDWDAALKPVLISKSLGLPPLVEVPDYIIPATGFDSHTTQIKKTFRL